MQVAIHPDEGLLYQVFRAITVADRTVDEVEQPHVVALDQLIERSLLAGQKFGDDRAVVELCELLRFAQHQVVQRSANHCAPLVAKGRHRSAAFARAEHQAPGEWAGSTPSWMLQCSCRGSDCQTWTSGNFTGRENELFRFWSSHFQDGESGMMTQPCDDISIRTGESQQRREEYRWFCRPKFPRFGPWRGRRKG